MTTSNHHGLSMVSAEVDHVDNHEQLISPNSQACSSSSSLSCRGSNYHWELSNCQETTLDNVSPCRSSDQAVEIKEKKAGLNVKLTIRKRKKTDNGSFKWTMSSKMMRTDETGDAVPGSSFMKFQSTSPQTDDNSSNSTVSNMTVRVCADCHTTKTPLWRSGPRGPKSLCNACGIRQRKARRAMAESDSVSSVKSKMVKKEKMSKPRCAPPLKKRCKLDETTTTTSTVGKNKFCFEEIMVKLSNNLSLQQVFPQDEKEAAILLMSLSYGLVHG